MSKGRLIAILSLTILISLVFVVSSSHINTLDLSTQRDFKVGDYSLQLKVFDNFIKVFGVNDDQSSFFSYRLDSTPEKTMLSMVDTKGNRTNVLVSNIPSHGSNNPEQRLLGYKGKFQEAILDEEFLKAEGYQTEIPVIITLEMGKSLDTPERNRVFAENRDELMKGLKVSSGRIQDLRMVNAVAARLSKKELGKLESMDVVKRVSLDKTMKIVLFNSTQVINATELWRGQDSMGRNITGENITIAIVDTGVDYTHADLGGCLGAGCKVIGGYDFVSNDNDPMDDQGHGTHCAGTAAGNGTVKGVAPEARILAYKVLDSGGSGSSSDVIAGIERALDPNDDGDYSDHADVISLSLGGGGTPDDEISQAVDAAVEIGAVVVVAAGNSGPFAESVGSPGCARKALTVGASCMPGQVGSNGNCANDIATFSSRGPTSIGGIKPDVLAPGVKICSAQFEDAWDENQCFDDEHTAISGTSMATPHVAGAAALLLQAHNWTPEQVKSALMTTATDFGYEPNSQGTGQINVLLANNASFSAEPGSIGLGNINTEDFSYEILLTNLKDTSITLSFEVSEVESAADINYSFASVNVTTLELDPRETRGVLLIINITGGVEGTFFGDVIIESDLYSSLIPFSFIKLSTLIVTVHGSQPVYPDLLLHSRDLSVRRGVYQGDAFDGDTYTFQVPAGNYTVYAVGDQEDLSYEYMLMELVELPADGIVTITMEVEDARAFTVGAESIDGQPLKLYKWEKGFVAYNGTSFLSYTFTDPTYGNRTIHISNKPDNGIDTDVILSYHGIPSDTAYISGGGSRSIVS